MPLPLSIYLDIETDAYAEITVIGFLSSATGVVQLVGSECTMNRLLSALPKAGRLYTFNGHAFDLRVIRDLLGVDLRERFESVDLMWECRRRGLNGGQKAIERRIGVARRTEGLSGRDAMELWSMHLDGDGDALPVLLRYNREDLTGMRAIRRHLADMGYA